jgi:effector-binding domain-containing protein
VVPAAELAVVTHHGSLDDADITSGALGSYVMRHELSVDGPLREYYVRSAHDSDDPGEWQTQLGWPIFRADATGQADGTDPAGRAG